MSTTANTPHPERSAGASAEKASRRFTRFVRKSLKPVIFKLTRKLSVTYWPARQRTISAMLIALLAQCIPGFAPGLVHAAPAGAQLVAGSASVSQASNQTTQITQTTQNAIINWQSFSIGAKETVTITQPTASSVLLNRVIGSDPSRIFGSLSANGQVFLVNSAGVYFAPGASVNVGALVASSMDVTNTNFLAGKYQFDAGTSAATVVNDGHLSGRYVVLSAPQVTNTGSIEAPSGAIALTAGGRVNLAIAGGNLVSVSVDAATANAAVVNSGSLHADGGKVFLTAHSSNALFDTVINTSGVVRATSLVSRNGAIVIDGGAAGVVQVGGGLAAAGVDGGGTGGTVKVLGQQINLLAGASVDVSGDAGGGSALIGGNFHGAGLETNAVQVRVDKGAVIDADAITSGNGGNVAVWADGHTQFAGSISAKGGALGGNGGFVETSGKRTLELTGSVNTSAAEGKTGTWLLDSTNITITDNGSATLDNSDGVFSATSGATASTVKASTLEAALASNNVVVDTASSGEGAGTITVAAPVTWNANLLTLKANTDININASLNAYFNASLALQYGQGAVAAGNLSTYNVNAPVNLPAGNHFSTMLGSDGSVKNYTVITSLGAMGSTTAADLQGMNGDPGANYALGASIDASPTAHWNGGAGFAPIGNANNAFTGNFEGLNHTINNLYINRPGMDSVGLFGYIGLSETGIAIRNVGLVGSRVVGRSYVGALLGESLNGNVTVANSYAAGSVSGVNYVGGLVGVSSGPVSNSYATGSVGGNDYVGGLMGYKAGTLSTSYATGSVSGNAHVGALLGVNYGGDITSGYWNSDVRAIGVGSGPNSGATGLSTAAMQKASSFSGWNIASTAGSGAVWRIYEGHTAPLLGSFLTNLSLANSVVTYNGQSQNGTGSAYNNVMGVSGRNVGAYAAYSNQQGYDITGGSLTIDKAAMTINAVTDARTYTGDTHSAGMVTSTGLFKGDTLTAASQSFGSKNVLGTGLSTLAVNAGYVVNDGNSAGNYSVTTNTAAGTITKAALGISAVADSKTYSGDTGSAVTVGITGLVGGDSISDLTQSFGSKNVLGTNASTLSVNSGFVINDGNSNGGNYNVVAKTALGTISQATLGIHAVADTRAYSGDINSAGMVTLTGLVGNDTVTAASQSFSSKNVQGTGNSTLSVNSGYVVGDGNAGGNYNVRTSTAAGTISQAALGIYAVADTRTYNGDTNSAGTVTFTGLVGGDSVTGASQSFNGKNVIGVGQSTLLVNPGYTVNDGNVGGNYKVIKHAAAGTISQAALSINAVTDARTYTGDTHSAGMVTSTGLFKGDTLTAASQSFGSKNVLGTGLSTLAVNAGYVVNDGNSAGNYSVTTNTAAGTITKAALGFNAVTDSKIYSGDTGSAAMVGITGLVGGDSISDLTQSFGSKNVLGTNASTLSVNSGFVINDGNRNGGNYVVTASTALGTISRLDSVTWTGNSNSNWSQASNWEGNAIPDLANVRQVIIPANKTVMFDANVGTNVGTKGAVQLDAINSAGALAISSGNLTVAGNLATGSYTQTGGVVSAGTLNASNRFHQTDGDLLVSGAVSISQASGAVVLGNASMAALTVTANGDILQNAATALTVSGATTLAAGASNMYLPNVGNDFGGNVNLAGGATSLTAKHGLSLSGNVAGNLTTQSAALNFAQTTVTGNLMAAANGAVTQSASLSVAGSSKIEAAGQAVTLNDAANAFAGSLTVAGAATQITNNGALTAHLTTTAATTVNTNANLLVDGAVTGDLSTSSKALGLGTTSVAGDLTIHSAALTFGTTTVRGNLAAVAGGAVGQTAPLSVMGNTSITAAGQSVVLNNAGNDFGSALSLTSGTAQLVDMHALTIGATTTGDLTLRAAGVTFTPTTVTGNMTAASTGAVGQTGLLTVTGNTSITAAGQSVTLNNEGNDFGGALTLAGAVVQVVDKNALTAHLATTGTTSLTAGNDLTVDGSVVGDVSTRSGALNFGATTLYGNLAAVAGGAVGQTAPLTVMGNTSIIAAGQSVVLNNAGNDFGSALSLTSGTAQLVDMHALTIGATTTGDLTLRAAGVTFTPTTVTGNMTAASTGAVGQTGLLTVMGNTSIIAAGQSVTLNNAANDFGGALTLAGAVVQVVDKNALTAHLTTTGASNLTSANGLIIDGSIAGDLVTQSAALNFGATTISGNLTVAASGAVGQSGALLVAGSTGIAAAGQSVILNNAGNDFSGTLSLTSGAAQLADMHALTVGATTTGDLTLRAAGVTFAPTMVAGNMTATSTDAVGQTGFLNVTGNTSIAAAGQSVTLNNAGNDFGGALTLAGTTVQAVDKNALTAHLMTTGATSLTAVNGLMIDGRLDGDINTHSAALTFGATYLAGNVSASATGAVSQTGALTVLGSADITASGQNVALANSANVFVGALTLTSAAAQIVDAGALTAHLNTTGATTISSGNALMLDGRVTGDLSTSSMALSLGATSITGKFNAVAAGAVSQSGALTVSGGTDIAAAGQSVTLNNAGNDFGGALSLTSGTAQLVDMHALTVGATTTGDLTLRAAGVTFTPTMVTGNMTTASTGAVGQTGLLTVTGNTSITAAGQSVTLNNAANDFGGGLTLAGAAVQVVDKNALTAHLTTTGASNLTSANGMTVDGSVSGDLGTQSAALNFGTTSVTGNLMTSASGAISQSGLLSVAGTSTIAASGQSVTLTNAGNDFGGALTLAGAATQIVDRAALTAHVNTTGASNLTSANGLIIDGSIAGDLVTQSAALNFGATTISGNLTVAASGAVGQSGALLVAGSTGIAAAGQSVILNNAGNDFSGTLSLTSGAAQLVDMHALTVGATTTGDLTLRAAGVTFAPTTVTGDMTVASTGAVGQTGLLTVTGNTSIAAAGQSVMLNNAGNDFGGALTLAGTTVQVVDKNALTAHLMTTGATSLTAVNGLMIDGRLDGDINTHSAALAFGATYLAGNVSASATGAVSQTGALTVLGSADITASGQNVALANSANVFVGPLTLTSAAAQIVDAGALTAHLNTTGATTISSGNALMLDGRVTGDLSTSSMALSLGATSIAGKFNAVAAGAVSQSGALTVSGGTDIAAAGQSVILNNVGNDFGGALTLAGAVVQVVDKNALTAHLTTTGVTSLTAGNDLTVDGSVVGDVSTRSGALNFGATTLYGNLVAVAGGAVGQTAPLSVTGNTSIAAAGQSVVLNNAGNDFVGTLSASGAAVTIVDSNVLTLGTVKSTKADLSANTLRMASGGIIDANEITLALGRAGTPLGSFDNPINVQGLASVTFGPMSPAVAAYFASVPTMTFKFDNPVAKAAYASGTPLIYVNNLIYNNQAILAANGTLYGSILRVLQAIHKKADGYGEGIDRGLPSNLAEYAAYPHTGSLKLQAPICAGVLRVQANSAEAVQARACTALIMVR